MLGLRYTSPAGVLILAISPLPLSLAVLVDRVIIFLKSVFCMPVPSLKKMSSSSYLNNSALTRYHRILELEGSLEFYYPLSHNADEQSASEFKGDSLPFLSLTMNLVFFIPLYWDKICHSVTSFPSFVWTSRPLPSLFMPVNLAMARCSTHHPDFPFSLLFEHPVWLW